MSTPLYYQQLPARCIIVQQHEWCFNAEIISKQTQLASRFCTSVAELCRFINDWQVLRKAGPVYIKMGQQLTYESLSYETAVELEVAELATVR